MSQLPRVANAILDDRRIPHYLLSTVHSTGGTQGKILHVLRFLARELGCAQKRVAEPSAE
jgi:hypothetical protein